MPCKCNNHMKNVAQLSIREGEKVHKPDIQEIKDIVAIKTFTEAKDEGERTTQMETAKEFFACVCWCWDLSLPFTIYEKMKILLILKKIGLSVIAGIIDSVPILPSIKKNLEDEKGFTSPGSLDIVRIASSIISLVLVVAFLMGKLTMTDLEKLLMLF